MFYSAVGGDLSLYSMDVDSATLTKRSTVSLPANVQYAWPHPSKKFLYVVSSAGGVRSREKMVWDWPSPADRVIEELR